MNINTKRTLIHSLVSSCSLFLFISTARAQPCTPVVYAFRHAEDLKAPGNGLTSVGLVHAGLYPSMVASFGAAHNYCPVGYVYATYPTNPDGGSGTNNPYQTAQPLAVAACHNQPPQNFGTCHFSPRTELINGGELYEYLGLAASEKNSPDGKPPKAGISATSSQLLTELGNFIPATGLSIAIFWTSQGLNVLGQAIVPDFTGIPGCSTLPPEAECKDLKAPRNAAYVFEFNGSSGFKQPANITQYVQCFNVHIDVADNSKVVGPEGTTYYCGNEEYGTGSLPSITNGLDSLQGMICDTSLQEKGGDLIDTGPRGYYGSCQ
ncbi:MAG: hypothetical protein ACLQAT_24290 [Candidatus Binataceae bacterium]